MRITLHPQAEQELLEAAEWYERRLPGLGEDLLAEIDRWLIVISEAPWSWPKWPDASGFHPPVLRALTSRFPFAIAYQVHQDHIAVIAFAHTSRRPFYWEDRTSG